MKKINIIDDNLTHYLQKEQDPLYNEDAAINGKDWLIYFFLV